MREPRSRCLVMSLSLNDDVEFRLGKIDIALCSVSSSMNSLGRARKSRLTS